MYRYLPSETFKNKFVIETKNRWLDDSLISAHNKATKIVLGSSNSGFYNFLPALFEELKTSKHIQKDQAYPLSYLYVDHIVGNNFRNILTCFTEVIHKCMYDTSKVLYSIHEFLDNFEIARKHFMDREMRFEKQKRIFKANKNLRKNIKDITKNVVKDNSQDEYQLIRSIELTEIIERHFYHILIQLTKLSLSEIRKDYSTCVQELLCLFSDIMNVSLKDN
jgi:hypothetical protein